MNLYEHTVLVKQDIVKKDLEKVRSKYETIIKKNSGKVVKFEDWGLMNLAYPIKKNKKGYFLHFKIESNENLISDLEKNERIDNQVLRFLTIKVKKFDLEVQYFGENKTNNESTKA